MKGFGERYATLPDFILGVTREIWEDRGVGPKLKRYYADDVVVRAADGLTAGNRGVIAATLQTLHQFPDRRLVGEDVVWTDDETRGFVSSHRLTSVMHHLGDGAYGRASGRAVRTRIIADCRVRDGQIVEEWLARDQGAIAACLGLPASRLAERLAEQDVAVGGKVRFFHPACDPASEFAAAVDTGGEAGGYADGWRAVWQEKQPAAIAALYHPDASVAVPGGDTISGHAEMDRFVLGYLASFPDAEFRIEQLIANRGDGQAVLRLAMRWSLTATHCGWGRFGMPSGAPVYVMGFTHSHLSGGRVASEWIVADEVSVWKQIVAHRRGLETEAAAPPAKAPGDR